MQSDGIRYTDSFITLPVDESSDTIYKDLFYKVFNISPILMAVSTIDDGVFVDVNKAWLNALGYSKEEVIGVSSQKLNIFVDFQERERVKQLIIDNGIARDQEIRFKSKSGEIRRGIFAGDIITLAGQKFLLTTAYDITDRKHMEEVVEKNRLLKEQLEYDKMKTSFLTTISHELKTPVNIIFSSLQLLNIIMGKDSLAEIKISVEKQAKLMKQNCYRLIRVINNLIDVTKAGSGYLKLTLDNIDIIALIKNITFSVAEYGKLNGVDINFNSQSEKLVIACDSEKIERIILNLLSNAIKFTPRNGSISVDAVMVDENLRIAVRDTGVGIPKAKQKQLFKRFYQVNNSLSKNNEGSGIGLSLAKSLAELHEGRLYLNSKYKTGCEFILELPVKAVKKSKSNHQSLFDNNINYIETIKVEFSDIYFED